MVMRTGAVYWAESKTSIPPEFGPSTTTVLYAKRTVDGFRGATHVVIAHRPQTRFERLRHASLVDALVEAPGRRAARGGSGKPRPNPRLAFSIGP
jgi:hypothetical protein